MKTLIATLVLATILLSSCTETVIGPRGEQGPSGPQGAAGENGHVFEFENIDFTSSNNYEVLLEYPDNFEGLQSDVALVYFLWPLEDNLDFDVWRPIPQTVLVDQGILQYNFDFTATDTRLFLESNFPLNQLTGIFTDGWVARVVIVPGDFWDNGRVDFSDYDAVASMLGLPELNVVRDRKMVRQQPD